ncbi:MAG: CYTH and CHAD domain-containing protein [Jatrophihabitans sp.]|uniref:CYTH and CHAD domain-containing protein n=1 Tax=Jatrophihabitans sp. TaxID=1932789 RepID=UPI003F7EF5A3
MDHRERELKFDVPVDWQLPDPSDLLPKRGSVSTADLELQAAYYDTAERHLFRSGLTLRRRRGGEDEGWHLKLPAGDARTEIQAPLGTRGLPAALRDATAGLRRGAPVVPIAEVTTHRQVTRLLAADGTPRLEFAVDDVTATASGEFATVRQWREVEIELLGGTEQQLQKAAAWLGRHGAKPSVSRSKLARALGASSGPERDRRTLAGALGRYLDEQFLVLVAGDVALRRSAGGLLDDATVHGTRVATRRYRSALRVFDDVFEADRAAALEAELGWYGELLGAVRDVHVLRDHLDQQLAEVPDELVLGPVAARIHARLAADEAAAARALATAMKGKRYHALLDELTAWRTDLPARDGRRKAGAALGYLQRAERTVRKRWAAVPDGRGRDAALHRVRKAAKRARYVAELTEPTVGKVARRVAKDAQRTQKVLGARQDQVVAADFLRRAAVAAHADGESTFTYGLLYERNVTEH